MEIVLKKLADLKPAEYNPRKMNEKEAADLMASLREFGFAEPIVINSFPGRENVIVGGHQRFFAAQQLGIAEIPCVYVNLPLDKEQRLNIRLNKNVGSWDYAMLANFNEDILLDTGFSPDELYAIFGEPEAPVLPDVSGGAVQSKLITLYYPPETFAEVEEIVAKFEGRTISDKFLAILRKANEALSAPEKKPDEL